MSQQDIDINAFPHEFGFEPGMTLRDYFAAKALQGMLSNDQIQMVLGKTITQADVVGACYEWANLMIEARQK